jgi:predicted outer membrane protein
MNVSHVSALASIAATPLDVQTPRAVDVATTRQFRELMSASDCDPASGACQPSPALRDTWNMDIEKIVMANLPAADASPAEFAISMLRAQVKVSQAAIAIEMVSKTTQSLSQGVQSLTTRS